MWRTDTSVLLYSLQAQPLFHHARHCARPIDAGEGAHKDAMPNPLALFDRFDTEPSLGMVALVRDITDLLGARRYHGGPVPGLLGWGLSKTIGRSPSSQADRDEIADQIADQLRRFEPRLTNVRVTPVLDDKEFAFEIEARVVTEDDERLILRVVTPRRGGGLGAELLVVGSS